MEESILELNKDFISEHAEEAFAVRKHCLLSHANTSLQTEIICTSYSDRIFVLISQCNKVGSLLTASHERSSDGGGKLFNINTLLGRRDDPLLNIYASKPVSF